MENKQLLKVLSHILITTGTTFVIAMTSFATTKATPSEPEKPIELFNETVEDCKDILKDLESDGIHMSDANTKDTVRAYTRDLLPDPEGISIAVAIYNSPPGLTGDMDFKPAIAGTRANKYGEEGQCYITLIVSYEESPFDSEWLESDKIRIIPTIYSGSSSSGSGGGGGSSSSSSSVIVDDGLFIHKANVYDGQWEWTNNNWHLRLNDNLLAANQWANINNKWYLFDNDGNMVTGWKKVNGKWYYLDPIGEMAIGWKLINGKYYFMDNSGAMLENTTTPDGYKVNKNGEWEN